MTLAPLSEYTHAFAEEAVVARDFLLGLLVVVLLAVAVMWLYWLWSDRR